MNFLAKTLLFIFIFAQSAPSIICLIDSDNDFSISLAEDEEKSKQEKEFKTDFILNDTKIEQFFFQENSKKITPSYLMKDYQVVSLIDILPPEQV
jgi:hypothetical protein